MEAERDVVRGNNGSLLYREGGSSLLCTLHGPREAPIKMLSGQKGLFRSTVIGSHQYLSEYMDAIACRLISLEEYPRSIIEVHIYVLESHANIFSSSVNALSMLLMSSGIFLNGFMHSTGGRVFLNACVVFRVEEEEEGKGEETREGMRHYVQSHLAEEKEKKGR